MTKLYTRFCAVTETANLYSRCDDFWGSFLFLLQNYTERKYRLIHFVVISHEVVPTDTSTVRKHKVPIKVVVFWDRPISSLMYNPLYLSLTSFNTQLYCSIGLKLRSVSSPLCVRKMERVCSQTQLY